MKKKENFWEVDLVALSKDWLSQIWVFLETGLAFIAIALPVLISAFILWAMAGFPSLTTPFQ